MLLMMVIFINYFINLWIIYKWYSYTNKFIIFKTKFEFAVAVVPGAGAFEIYAWQELQKYKDEIKGKSRLGIQAYAEALLIIPKTICESFLLK